MIRSGRIFRGTNFTVHRRKYISTLFKLYLLLVWFAGTGFRKNCRITEKGIRRIDHREVRRTADEHEPVRERATFLQKYSKPTSTDVVAPKDSRLISLAGPS